MMLKNNWTDQSSQIFFLSIHFTKWHDYVRYPTSGTLIYTIYAPYIHQTCCVAWHIGAPCNQSFKLIIFPDSECLWCIYHPALYTYSIVDWASSDNLTPFIKNRTQLPFIQVSVLYLSWLDSQWISFVLVILVVIDVGANPTSTIIFCVNTNLIPQNSKIFKSSLVNFHSGPPLQQLMKSPDWADK